MNSLHGEKWLDPVIAYVVLWCGLEVIQQNDSSPGRSQDLWETISRDVLAEIYFQMMS